jgi:hypothetical protein
MGSGPSLAHLMSSSTRGLSGGEGFVNYYKYRHPLPTNGRKPFFHSCCVFIILSILYKACFWKALSRRICPISSMVPSNNLLVHVSEAWKPVRFELLRAVLY